MGRGTGISFPIFCALQAASFGGTNIDPNAWEDKKWRGQSRFPAQVRVGGSRYRDECVFFCLFFQSMIKIKF